MEEAQREGKGWRKCNRRCVQIQWKEEESNYKKVKKMKCNGEVASSARGKEAKREGKGQRKCNHRCVLIGRRRDFCFVFVFCRE